MVKNAMKAAFAAVVVAALSACSTVQGVGKDVQKGGKAIEKGAKAVEQKL